MHCQYSEWVTKLVPIHIGGIKCRKLENELREKKKISLTSV